MRVVKVPALVCVGLLMVLGWSVPAGALGSPGGQLYGESAVAGTPHVLDGRVFSVTQVGNTILLGGTFTTARNDASTTVLSRANLLAFNATTGQISTTFVPQPNGAVQKILDSGDGTTVYVGGNFTTIGGVARQRVARIRISDGAVVTGFNAGTVSGQVRDMALSKGRLWVGGAFTHLGGAAQRGLGTLNPQTGARTTFMTRVLAGTHNGGTSQVLKFDLTPAGDRLVAVGNFDTLDGVTNHQLLMLDTAGASAVPSTFRTGFYRAACSASFDTYLRDVDFAPDGSFFVVSTTGAYGGSAAPCDSTARFETSAAGADVVPSWVNYTGGDTTYGVEVTPTAVYVGGHFRWQNNAFRGDAAGQGAVPREGLAALDPINGLPYSWNPGRTKGVGVFDFLAADNGLWVASDTDRIGNYQLRSRIARLRTGGPVVAPVATPQLPNDLYAVANTLSKRGVTPTSVGTSVTAADGGIAWSSVRAAFMVNGWLYLGQSDGSFTRRTFDGTTYGPAEPVTGSEQVVTFTDWRNDLANATGMFFDSGRLYFTRSGSSQLFYRYFTPESGVVGAKRLVAANSTADINFQQVRGMVGTGSQLYWADNAGRMWRMGWQQGAQAGSPLPGTASVFSGPAADGVQWNARAYFLYQGADGRGAAPNQAPTASFTRACTGLTCTVDASASSDPDGQVTSWAWDFGDGQTGTGATAQHTYAAPGSYTVTLTVTDQDGASATQTAQVDPAALPAAQIQFVGAQASNANSMTQRVAVPAEVAPGDTLVLRMAVNSSAPAINDPAGWTLLGQVNEGNVQGRLWTRTATATDAGSVVTVGLSSIAKADLTLTAHRADHGASAVSDAAIVVRQGGGPQFAAPDVTAGVNSSISSSWVAKAGSAVAWTAGTDTATRAITTGTGGGALSSLSVERIGPVPAGPTNGDQAGADPLPTRVIASSVVITPV